MLKSLEASIANPHWRACKACKHQGENGCELGEFLVVTVHLGNWLLCDDYESKQDAKDDE